MQPTQLGIDVGNPVNDDRWVGRCPTGRLAAFAAAFAGCFLLGGVVIGVTFFELHRQPVETKSSPKLPMSPSKADDRSALDAELRKAHDRTADARRQADATEIAVFEFLNDRFIAAAEPSKPEAGPKPGTPALRPKGGPNPEWVETSRQLLAMQQKRTELLVKLTPAHPTVQALDGRIAELEDLRAGIPAELPFATNELPNERSIEDSGTVSQSVADAHSEVKPPSADVQRTYYNLMVAAGHARDAYRAAVQSENEHGIAWQRGGRPMIAMDRPGSIDLVPNELDSAPTAANGPAIPIVAIAFLALFSMYAGVVAAGRVRRRPLTFMSSAEIEATLGLPVLGRFGRETDRPGANAA